MITVYTGPMFAGKSSKLIEKYASIHNVHRVLAFKPSKDTRDKTKIKSREYIKTIDAIVIKKFEDILKYVSNDCKVIMIDEAQFIEGDPKVLLNLSIKEEADIYVAGLSLTSEQEPFGKMPEILALADRIIFIQSDCHFCGRPAQFTKCLEKKDEEILVGSDQYIPVCKYCMRDRF
ncbi:MAG: hypothetical protein IJF92_00605 [Bacilli bacterium]|nr:hypothetical protein [Bacilli bacterium]MBQ3307686.1 hypothetical protein [Bacilli bacterium]